MSSFVSTHTEVQHPDFGQAWRTERGDPRAIVHLGVASLSFDDPATAREVAAACIAAAEAMEALPPAETEPETPRE